MRASKRVAAVLMILSVLTGAAPLDAQPALTFTRIVNNWPDIELNFYVSCDGVETFQFDSTHIRVYENGVQIDTFTLWRPDPNYAGPVSVALVLDASASMGGAENAGLKAAGLHFVGLLDGVVDEAAVIWFSSVVTVQKPLTTNKTDLADAVNSLPAWGATAVWDGIYTGVQEVHLGAVNQCRAVIATTDGGDNSSSHTPDEIIALARMNNIRVFTIGIGAVTPTQLQTIASQTDGTYYAAASPDQLPGIFEAIEQRIRQQCTGCKITYRAACSDGNEQNVELMLRNFCGGDDSKTRTYLTGYKPETLSPMNFKLGTAESKNGQSAALPLTMTTPLQDSTFLQPATFRVLFDTNLVALKSFAAPPSTMLENVPVTILPVNGGIEITTKARKMMNGPGILGYLTFRPVIDPQDSIACLIELDRVTLSVGCFLPAWTDGFVTIHNYESNVLTVDGSAIICENDSVRLRAGDALTNCVWSTGQAGKILWVKQPGKYWLRYKDPAGYDRISDTIVIFQLHAPVVDLVPSGTVTICRGGSVRVSVLPVYEEYQWSTGDTSTVITATEEGDYWCMARGSNGCWGRSATLTVKFASPNPQIQGPAMLCAPASEAEYSLPFNPTHLYDWRIAGAVLLTPPDSNAVRVRVTSSSPSIIVLVRDTATNCSVYDTLAVTVQLQPPAIALSAAPVICSGDSVTLSLPAGYDMYEWNTGGTENQVVADTPGVYFCRVISGPCEFYTDTVRVYTLGEIVTRITGDSVVCEGDTVLYSATDNYPLPYRWSAENGTVAQNGSTATIVWKGAGQRKVTLEIGPEGCSATAIRTVIVTPVPAKPFITANGLVLTCSGSGSTYQWYLDGRPIPGATSGSIAATESGSYTVRITNAEGCSTVSDPMTVSGIGRYAPDMAKTFSIAPNPSDGNFRVELAFERPTAFSMQMVNLAGQTVFSDEAAHPVVSYQNTIRLSDAPPGMYLFILHNGGVYDFRKVVIHDR